MKRKGGCRMDRRTRAGLWLLLFLALFFALNLASLTRFPLVHSDESWLSGLTRNMMESGSLGVTEPFFDLKPRYPHAIKALFHVLQMPLIQLFGYSAFSVRLLSLLFATGCLFLAYRCARENASSRLALCFLLLVCVNGSFLAAAHTARQEIVLLCAMLLLLLILLKGKGDVTTRHALLLGAVTGLCVGIHPNSLLLCMGCGFAMLFPMLARRKIRWKPLAAYVTVTGMIAFLFVGISFSFDHQFPAHYMAYGESEFDLIVPISNKFGEFGYYIQKLWYGVSGTYTLPLLRPQLLLCLCLAVWAGIRAIRTKDDGLLIILGMCLGALLGTIVIGRYNQLSAVLWMFLFLMLLPPLLAKCKGRKTALLALTAIFAVSSVLSFAPAFNASYDDYLDKIAVYVAPGEKTLANLNTGFYFANDALLDYRNLSYLQENGLSFAQYVKSRGIQVILWSEEMDFIYQRRPTWNIIYGNPRYVEEVEAFLVENCTELGTFEDAHYAVRIVSEIGKPYRVRVYHVIP